MAQGITLPNNNPIDSQTRALALITWREELNFSTMSPPTTGNKTQLKINLKNIENDKHSSSVANPNP